MESKDAARAKKAMTTKVTTSQLHDKDFLSWGLSLLNLSCYGRINGGILKGKIYRVIGKSQSAKSFLCRTLLAEAANNPEFSNYELIHDDIEKGVLMDNRKFFGLLLAKRVCAPGYTKDKRPIYSSNLMEFFRRVRAKIDKGKKFIWIVDSYDALVSDITTKMSDGKAKVTAQEMRGIINGLAVTGGIMILVQHAKVNLGWAFGQDVTTGGSSPEFYSSMDVRLSKMGAIKKKIGERSFPIGNKMLAHVTKNRVTGQDRTVGFNLYTEYGIDDIGSCVDFIVQNEHWVKGKGGIITADEFKFEGTVTKLIHKIENANQERELRVLTAAVWRKIEESLSLHRRPRYT